MEITEDEKKALLAEFIEKTKAALVLEAKSDIEQINKLIKDQRTEYDKFLEGKMTASDFKTFEEKSIAAEKKIQERVDKIETKMARPPIETPEGLEKKVKPGQMEYKAAFFNFMRSGKGGELILDDAAEKYDLERKALVADTTGQILIPEETEAEIYRELPKINVIRKYATQRTIATNRIRRRSMTEVTMGWGALELGGEPDETDVVPAEAYQYIEDLEGLARIGKNELKDTDISLEAVIVDSFGRAKAETEETAYIKGTGHANRQPDGICLGTTVTRRLTAASDAIVIDDVINVIYDVPAQYRRNATFLTASTTIKAMRKLKDEQSQYLWSPSVQAGQPSSILGYPVEAQEDLDALTTAEGDIAIFGDLKAGYRILDREGMTIQRLLELWATAGLVGLLVSSRVTGGVIRANALRILKLVAG